MLLNQGHNGNMLASGHRKKKGSDHRTKEPQRVPHTMESSHPPAVKKHSKAQDWAETKTLQSCPTPEGAEMRGERYWDAAKRHKSKVSPCHINASPLVVWYRREFRKKGKEY